MRIRVPAAGEVIRRGVFPKQDKTSTDGNTPTKQIPQIFSRTHASRQAFLLTWRFFPVAITRHRHGAGARHHGAAPSKNLRPAKTARAFVRHLVRGDLRRA